MVYLLFSLLPFIQIGINWWIGIPLFCLILLLISLKFGSNSEINFAFFGFLAGSIILATAINSSGDTRELLRALRELLVFLFMLLALSPIVFKDRKFLPEKMIRILCLVSLSILLLTLFQFVAIRSGYTFSLPESWYPRKLFTPTSLDFNYSQIRPSATFTEPSYLGLFSYAILTMGVLLRRKYQNANFLIYTSVVTIALSQSKSGILFSCLLFSSLFIANLRNRNIESLRISTVLPLISILVVILFLFNFQGLGESASVQDRILIPTQIVFHFFLSHPFGIPYYQRLELPVLQLETTNWFALSHNGLLNLIFDYGILGVIVIITISLALRNDGVLFLFFIYLGIQNGSFLDFDKAVLALSVTIFLRTCRSLVKLS